MSDPALLHHGGLEVAENTVALILQTMVFGIHLVLAPFGVYTLLKQGYKTKSTTYIWLAMLAPFVLSSAYWALRLVDLIIRISSLASANPNTPYFSTYYTALFNSIILLNPLVSDFVVMWRAWELCKDESRRLLLIPALCLILTTLAMIFTIGTRIVCFSIGLGHVITPFGFSKALDILQPSSIIFSFLTNLTSTFTISLKAWRLRRTVKANLQYAPNSSARVKQILILLIETGFLYCIFEVLLLALTRVRTPSATLGDIFTPMGVTFSGLYPTIVIMLVSLQRSMSSNMQWSTAARPSTAVLTSHIASVHAESYQITPLD